MERINGINPHSGDMQVGAYNPETGNVHFAQGNVNTHISNVDCAVRFTDEGIVPVTMYDMPASCPDTCDYYYY